jgi:glutathione S-transferase
VPVLDDDGFIVTESAAICMHLAEKYPESKLLPPAGTPDRTAYYKWISYILTEVDAPLWTIAKHRFGLPEERRVPAVIETAEWEFGVAAKVLAAGVGDRPYLVANTFTVADILAGHTLLWAKSARLQFDFGALVNYFHRLDARNGYERARDKMQVLPVLPG